MKGVFKSFWQFSLIFISIFVLFELLLGYFPIYTTMRAILYYEEYPVPFVALFLLTFIASIFIARTSFFDKFKTGWRYVAFYLSWIVLLAILVGPLWSFCDMESGFFPEGDMFWHKIIADTAVSLWYTPMVIFGSSVLSFFIVWITFAILKINRVFEK